MRCWDEEILIHISTSTFLPYYVSLGLNLSAQEQSRLSTLHLVGGVARVGREEGVEEEGVARKRKKKMRLNKICADTKECLVISSLAFLVNE